MTAYYNEIDPYAAQWLRNLIDDGHIARGDVDERSIVDVRPDDLRGYTQAHFFAGVGGWSIALRLAGWPDDRPVWTGSCPCQPFSSAGAGKAANDERHLWPAWLPLIAECRPPIVFGEQVEAAVGWGWLDAVFSDLESEGYACGAAVLPACGIGAPHIRQRLWFVADAGSERHESQLGSLAGAHPEARSESSIGVGQPTSSGAARIVANAERTGVRHQGPRTAESAPTGMQSSSDAVGLGDTAVNGSRTLNGQSREGARREKQARGSGVSAPLGNTDKPRLEGRRIEPRECPGERIDGTTSAAGELANSSSGREERPTEPPRQRLSDDDRGGEVVGLVDAAGEQVGISRRPRQPGAALAGFWADAECIPCTDGKARPVGPGSFPLGHGIRNRASKLRAYGNAIVPQVAAEFIRATEN